MPLIRIALGHLASAASVLGLFFTLAPISVPRPWWQWAMLGVYILATAASAVAEWNSNVRLGPKRFKNQNDIKRYMEKWIGQEGRTVIMSRDMSWADQSKTKQLLLSKAQRGELTLCLENDSEQLQQLKDAGMRLHTYSHLGFVPRSRFTIIDFEKDGARVAIGVKDGGTQVIQEFQEGRHPLYGVASDLVNLVQKIAPAA